MDDVETLRAILGESLAYARENYHLLSDAMKEQVMGFIERLSQRLESAMQNVRKVSSSTQETLQILWHTAGQNPDAFISYLQNFPDPNINALLSNPHELARIVTDLEQQPTIQLGESQGIPESRLQSSNIYGSQYNPKTKELIVKFNGKNVKSSGPLYRYEGVPPLIARLFEQGAIPARTNGHNRWGQWWKGKKPSKGASHYNLIRNGAYPYQRIA